jgi:hypothetical protein
VLIDIIILKTNNKNICITYFIRTLHKNEELLTLKFGRKGGGGVPEC